MWTQRAATPAAQGKVPPALAGSAAAMPLPAGVTLAAGAMSLPADVAPAGNPPARAET